MLHCFTHHAPDAIPITFITAEDFSQWVATQSSMTKNWLEAQCFNAKPDNVCCIPNEQGKLSHVVVGHRYADDLSFLGALPATLPHHVYVLTQWHPLAALAWGLGAYQFTRYKVATKPVSQLTLPETYDHQPLFAQIKATYLVRDLINTPAEDLGPAELAATAERLSKEFGSEFKQIVGHDLLTHHYPAIHAVGRASTQAPRLIELRWGDKTAPKVTLVGKGVCFDSGGLDLKTSAGMALMKKDMGGAAHVLGLAYLIMEAKLPIHLRVLMSLSGMVEIPRLVGEEKL